MFESCFSQTLPVSAITADHQLHTTEGPVSPPVCLCCRYGTQQHLLITFRTKLGHLKGQCEAFRMEDDISNDVFFRVESPENKRCCVWFLLNGDKPARLYFYLPVSLFVSDTCLNFLNKLLLLAENFVQLEV